MTRLGKSLLEGKTKEGKARVRKVTDRERYVNKYKQRKRSEGRRN